MRPIGFSKILEPSHFTGSLCNTCHCEKPQASQIEDKSHCCLCLHFHISSYALWLQLHCCIAALCQCCGVVFWDTIIVPSFCVIQCDNSDA